MSDRKYAETDPSPGTAVLAQQDQRPRILPPYHVLLLDDDDHTYEYVIKMLRELFRLPLEGAYLKAVEVDTAGRAVVDTTSKERAELKRDQIHAFGRDQLINRCAGSMSAVIEPAAGP